jgi:hypothetical protein
VILSVAIQVTSSRKNTQILKIEKSVERRGDNAAVKIYQVGIGGAVSLGKADSVRIMACVAGGPDVPDMLVV